jgi:hypothetical protein
VEWVSAQRLYVSGFLSARLLLDPTLKSRGDARLRWRGTILALEADLADPLAGSQADLGKLACRALQTGNGQDPVAYAAPRLPLSWERRRLL